MKFLVIALLAVQSILSGCSIPKDFEVTITQEQVNTAIAKAPKEKAVAYGLMTVALDELALKVGDPAERIGVVAQPTIKIIGLPPFISKIRGNTNLTYDDTKKIFYLNELNIESIEAPSLPKSMMTMETKIKEAVNKQFSDKFMQVPIYQLSENGSINERTARRYLKSIKISDGKIVAILSVK